MCLFHIFRLQLIIICNHIIKGHSNLTLGHQFNMFWRHFNAILDTICLLFTKTSRLRIHNSPTYYLINTSKHISNTSHLTKAYLYSPWAFKHTHKPLKSSILSALSSKFTRCLVLHFYLLGASKTSSVWKPCPKPLSSFLLHILPKATTSNYLV